MKKKIIAAILLSGILAVSACGGNKPAESTTTTAAPAAAATTTENKTTETEKPETDAPETEPSESKTEAATDETKAEPSAASSVEIPGDLLIESGVECSFENVLNATKDILNSGEFTYNMSAEMDYQGQPMKMRTLVVKSPELGTYTDADLAIMKTKMIYGKDGKITIINDDEKTYVVTTQEESGMSESTNTDTGLVPVKEPVNTADLIQFENRNKRAYRFLITADNNAGGDAKDDVYVYADADTLIICGMYAVQNNVPTKIDLNLSKEAEKSYFKIPDGYTEITMEQYQQQLLAGLNITVPDEGGNE